MTHKKSTADAKPPENTETTRWGIPWRFVGLLASGVAGFLITPYMQVGNDLKAHAIYACMAMTLYLFVLLLIYLYAYKEELSGFISKIFKTIKNFALNIWGKLNSTKKLIRAFAIFAGLSLLLLLIYNIIENSILHSEKIRNLPEGFNFSLKSNELSEIQNIRKSTFFYTSGALLVALLLTLSFTKRLKLILQEHILRIFVLTVVFGGVLSFFIPAFLYNYGFIGETKDLTTALFTITGGTIALFSLIKSHQKSELEREQLDTQKQKDARDHIRQLHNSYNDRFDKAVAELNGSDVKASYTAVPKLAKLADAWLDYKDLSNDTKELEKLKDKAEKEAQTIINILCKYIRTIPNNYTHEQLKEFKSLPESDIEILTHEVDIRRLIFSEISKRSSTFTRDGFGKIIDTYTGTWSDFEFDFSRAPIFYPLSSLTIEKGNFSSAKFYSNADFSGATFTQTADFSKATFTQNANFSWATFTQTADFESATFTQTARFHVTKFTQDANFRWATFTQTANFRSATFTQTANFRSATFERFEPTFATKLGKARFSAGTSPQNYMFSVAPDSKPINCKPATLLGKTFIIPLGTVLFDPDSPPKDHLGNYTVQSASAE
ncbi:pentapeptide repeat-containing protein [Rothia sp. HMSC072B03]|uniref:pentapeptide repeat-containing protein n=1 Tax=Rothia sp. HMSC072B03 TaxID=1715109 RepID=UPI000AD8605B|nr:pentapeptide repeat-containing protein [Rothia sp. HMSC072B03]